MVSEVFALIALTGAFTLVDPPNLAYSTYLPGPAAVYSIVNKTGALYFTFDSTSACDAGPAYDRQHPVVATFIGRLEREGQAVTWMACLPGASAGLAIDDAGALYVATNSSGSSTVTKLAPDTLRSVYATTLRAASVTALASDRTGSVYAAGVGAAGMLTTPGAYLGNCNTAACGFVTKLGPSGTVSFATYTPTRVNAIAVDSRGQAWITGTDTVKTSVGGDTTYSFAFVSKLDAEGKARLFNRGFGGAIVFRTPVNGAGGGIAIDREDAAYAVGVGGANVPTTHGTIQPSTSSQFTSNPYLVKFDSAGTVAYGTYLSQQSGSIDAISVDISGNAYVGVMGQYRPTSAKGACGWGLASTLMAINRDGSKVLASHFVGGWILSLTLHESGAVYVSGATTSTAFLATPGAYQSEYPTLPQSAFAAKVDFSAKASPILTCVTNAASGWAGRNASGFSGAVAPGELVTIYGEPFEAGQDVSVTFDDVLAPILYSGVNQINAVVPFRTGTKADFTQLSIKLGAQVIGPYRLPVSRAVPGMFLRDGVGAVTALNQDGSTNSITNPAPPGSVVTVYVTGAGLFDREIEDGSPGPTEPPFPTPVLGVRVAMWSTSWPTIDAPVLFAGQAPGLIAGVVQVNLQIPEGLAPGPAYLVMYFGDFPTPNPIIFVRGK